MKAENHERLLWGRGIGWEGRMYGDMNEGEGTEYIKIYLGNKML